jgi:hypothetical protein
MNTDLNLQAIRAALDEEPWEEDPEDDSTEVRRIFLGTVFALTPSGKFYTPFACGNVAECSRCGGRGARPRFKRPSLQRRREKAIARRQKWLAALHEREKRGEIKFTAARWKQIYRGWRYLCTSYTCEHCAGCGSREAHLDELWREKAEAEMESIGASLENGEGDPCDLFVVERREAQDDDSDEESDEE